jgi:hypothetical protein
MNQIWAKGDTFIATASYECDGHVQANARLIAAAPDLLFACRKALCELSDLTFDMDNYESPNIEHLRAVIQRVEDES